MSTVRNSGSIIFVGLLTAAVHAQLPPPPKPVAKEDANQPRLFVPQRVLDVGKILEGDAVPLRWAIENRGSAELVISRIAAGCGCTVLKESTGRQVVSPGEAFTIEAVFDSTNRFGRQSKAVSVFTNDPAEPQLKLEFTSEVQRLYEREPSTALNLRMLRRGETAKDGFTVLPAEGFKTAEIKHVELKGPSSLLTSTEPLERDGRTGQRLSFRIPADAALGAISNSAQISLEVDGIPRTTTLIIRGQVSGDLVWIPTVIDATRQPSIHGKTLAPVTIRAPNNMPFEILSASAGPLLDVEVRNATGAKAGRQYDVALTVREDAPPGPFGARLDVRTSSLDQPVVEIPVFGIVADRIEVDPPVILFREDGSALGSNRLVKLQTAPTATLDLGAISSPSGSVEASVDYESSQRYRHIRYVNVRYTGGLPPGVHESSLRIDTNVAGLDKLEIPVIIDVPEK